MPVPDWYKSISLKCLLSKSNNNPQAPLPDPDKARNVYIKHLTECIDIVSKLVAALETIDGDPLNENRTKLVRDLIFMMMSAHLHVYMGDLAKAAVNIIASSPDTISRTEFSDLANLVESFRSSKS